MIASASALLEEFIRAEVASISSVSMPHMPTLGEAYEAITKTSIDQSFVLPSGLDLHVVSGFISAIDGYLSGQVDCMLIHGEGTKYGLTDKYVVPIERVLCVVEVKKTLSKADLKDAIEHLGGIKRAFGSDLVSRLDSGWSPDLSHCSRLFAKVTGRVGPTAYQQIFQLPSYDQILCFSLLQELLAPAFIIHGYGGYRTEAGLRKAFMDVFEEAHHLNLKTVSIPTIPTLVTSGHYSLIKSSGLPFLMMRQNSLVVLGSCRHNPARMILEVVWSKLAAYFRRPMPFNDTLWKENVFPLLVADASETDGRAGWICTSWEMNEGKLKRGDNGEWQPYQLGAAEVSIMNLLAFRGGEIELDAGLEEYIMREHKRDLQSVTESLVLSRELMIDKKSLRLVGDFVMYLEVSEDVAYIASDRDLFDMWCDKRGIDKHYISIVRL